MAIVGESGGGKSTLLRLSNGLLQQRSNALTNKCRLEGSVSFREQILAAPHEEFGYVPQNFAAGLYPAGTAKENVLMAVSEDGISPAEMRLTDKLLDVSGLSDVAHLNVRRLSGGQQQRVAICRALVKQPAVLFMDEPFANLDSTLRPEMAGLLKSLRDTENLAVLCVTHDIEGAISLSDIVVGVKSSYGCPAYETWNVHRAGPPPSLRAEIEKWIDHRNG